MKTSFTITDLGILIVIGIFVYNSFFNKNDMSVLEKEMSAIKIQIHQYDSTARANRDTVTVIEKEKTAVYNKYFKVYENNKDLSDSLIRIDFINRVNRLLPARFNNKEGEQSSN